MYVLDFSVNDKGFVEYKPSFEPQIKDPKFDLGLAGELCQIFIEAISEPQKDEITNDKALEQVKHLVKNGKIIEEI